MKKHLLFICLLIIPFCSYANSSLTSEQKERAESAVKTYFSLLAEYTKQPMGAEALEIRNDIVLMFENMFEAPVYNDLQALKSKTNLGASCTIDDYLLAFGLLNDQDSYTFEITYDSIECQPLQIPSFAEGYDDLNALVYVNKHIKGGGISEDIKNVFRFNLNTNKISYIEKASFSTNNEDVNFLLKNHLGYSTAKLNELASRCYQEKKYKQAYKLYEQAAIRDDLDSQYALANMLYKRQGCEEYGTFATINMTKFWLKKIYFKYLQSTGTKIFEIGIYKPAHKMIEIVFYDEPKFYSDLESQPFNSGLMKYKIPGENKYGFCNMKGEMVISPQYSLAFSFTEGLAYVIKNGKAGYIDTKGEIVIPFNYLTASPFVNGTAAVSVSDTINGEVHRRYYLINKKGEKISEDFDIISDRMSKDELLMIAKRGNKYGFIDGLGKIKVPFIYDELRSSTFAVRTKSDHFVAVKKDGKWGFLDTSSSAGKLIVSPKYDDVGTFLFGMAWVKDQNSLSFIDKTGNVVCGGYISCTPFNAGGLACVKTKPGIEAYLINKSGDIVFYCDKNGEKLSRIRRVK